LGSSPFSFHAWSYYSLNAFSLFFSLLFPSPCHFCQGWYLTNGFVQFETLDRRLPLEELLALERQANEHNEEDGDQDMEEAEREDGGFVFSRGDEEDDEELPDLDLNLPSNNDDVDNNPNNRSFSFLATAAAVMTILKLGACAFSSFFLLFRLSPGPFCF
jgi:hypothetical protein